MKFKRKSDLFAWRFHYKLVDHDSVAHQYAVFYGCSPSFGSEYLWVYSRKKFLAFDTLDDISRRLRKMGVNMNSGLTVTDQTNCD